MILSHKHQFIFFSCGKTGSTSVRKALKWKNQDKGFVQRVDQVLEEQRRKFSKPYHPVHARPSVVRHLLEEEKWNTYFKFVFVRNPWDWVLSQFCFNNPSEVHALHQFTEFHVDHVFHHMKLHNQVEEDESYFQHRFVLEEDGSKLVDFVGRYERFQDDFDAVCEKIGFGRIRLPRKNQVKHANYKQLYTQGAVKRVAELYIKDIELLGYDF